MSTSITMTPEGSRDILFEECRAQREAQARLSRIFALHGYHEVVTPGLEYYDIFRLPGAAIPQQEMYKATDHHGRLLVFRPDSTLPIARMAASRLQDRPRPLRLFYSQQVYRNRPELSGRSSQCAQMGIELLGAAGLRADLEVVSLAVEALSACSADFRIELGHAGFFKALAERLPLPEQGREELRALIEAKNYGALGSLLDPLGDAPAVRAMKRLPRLFGREEVLEEAERWCPDDVTAGMLSYLKTLYRALEKLGLGDRLMVDLGLVQRNDYYTGMVFSAYVQDYGEAVLTGGRYDRLCEKFGEPMPAVGFALDLDAAATFLAGEFAEETPPAVLVFGEEGFETEARKLADRYTALGLVCEGAVCESWEEALNYARAAGIAKAVRVGETVEEIELKGGAAV